MVPSADLSLAFGTVPLQPRDPSALAQFFGTGIGATLGVVLSGVVALVVASVAPKLTDRSLQTIRDDGVVAFLVGLGVSVVGGVVLVLLAMTGIGLLLAIPGVIVLVVLGIAGSAVGVLFVGRFVLDAVSSSAGEPDTLAVAFAGAVVLGVVSLIPIVGGLVNFAVSTTGFGAVAFVLWNRRS